ncbi:MAG: (d)CMP kinase [Candidatus Omnitrophica bacterium]|nr:(d)CMP kinase [Candidatus Omnitrophota bacterium]
MIIAIDGPAGAGKSTVAKIIAKKLGFLYIDTGAMYRAITLKALENGIDIKDTQKITEAASASTIDLINNPDSSLKVLLDSRDVSLEIRQPRITQFVSDIAKIKSVREVMLKMQRKLGHQVNAVLDGRDIGTVVFPDAKKKFYIDADFKERVNRRHKELKDLDQGITVESVSLDLSNRDTIDSTRECAPLKKADDAIFIDTTNLTIEEVAEKVLGYIHG